MLDARQRLVKSSVSVKLQFSILYSYRGPEQSSGSEFIDMKYKHRREPKNYVYMEVLRLTPIYTELCHLALRPTITFDRTTLRTLRNRKYISPTLMGMAFRAKNWIWINPNHGVEEVRDTLAHEFIHFRFPYLYHGSQFKKQVRRLLDGNDLGTYRPKIQLSK